MRFLADENFPQSAIVALQSLGHDVDWVGRTSSGAADSEVLAWAVREKRVLPTFDKDFGELARDYALPHECGVVLLRTPMPKAGEAGQRLAGLIAARDDWSGYFSIIELGRVRMRPLA